MSHHESKVAVLRDLSKDVADLTTAHEDAGERWFPTQLLTAFFDDVQSRHTSEQVRAIPHALRATFALNFLTEEGLPHFHRLVATHLGDEGPWRAWNNRWTAEESQHGDVLGMYLTITGIVDRLELDKMKFAYIRSGFHPTWGLDPFKLLSYTSLQELATQMSHYGLSKQLSSIEPVLAMVLRQVAKDEARHYGFYREVYKRILAADPDRALESLDWVIRDFAMPGEAMPHFLDLAAVQERIGIFTTVDYQKIVSQLITFWNIERLAPCTDAGRKAQADIIAFPRRLDVMIRRNERSLSKKRTFTFPFLSESITV